MSRLIDADKLIKQLDDDIKITEKYVERSIKKNDNDGYIRYSNQLNTLQSYRLIIKDMKTAYDVDKVVEQLKELKDKALKRREELIELNSYNNIILKNIEYERGREYSFDDAIDIVKDGGRDEKN